MPITLGVDGHKQQHTIVALNAVGQPLDERTIPNTSAGYQQAFDWACQLDEIRTWGVENSGHLSRGFAQFLVAQHERVFEVSPNLTSRQRRRSKASTKSDSHDALAVGRIALQEGDKLPVVPLEDETMQVKLLVEHRDNLVREQTRLINQLHRHLMDVDPQYKQHIGEVNRMRTLRTCQSYPLDENDPIQQVRGQLIQQLATLILQLKQPIKALEAQLKTLVQSIAPTLGTILGINTLNAAQLIGQVGRIEQVASAAALAQYAGLAPIRHGSAGPYYHRVNPRGDRQLKTVFHLIAQTQSRCSPHAQAYLAKKKAEGKTPKHAFRCLKRRMVDIVYAVWKKGQPYQAPVLAAAEVA
ncbi:MAG: IS110 family transposase [Candidatus Latescibacteria bacterium]|nr:IS110 family transposase [Candidatus Latescibacterota bacterium]